MRVRGFEEGCEMTHEEAWTLCRLRAMERTVRRRKVRRWYRVARRWMMQGAVVVGITGWLLFLLYFTARLGSEVTR
ncbi:MAG: hypothetical protein PUB60_05735 [Veillonellaceae bacterium]|nr:hypothetical protein [Veillonellaceae bacterium]